MITKLLLQIRAWKEPADAQFLFSVFNLAYDITQEEFDKMIQYLKETGQIYEPVAGKLKAL